jgi:hypothetical protein
MATAPHPTTHSESREERLRKHVCAVEFAQELKNTGIKQESYWYWVEAETDMWVLAPRVVVDVDVPAYSAFTVAELKRLLPPDYRSWRNSRGWVCKKDEFRDGEPVLNGARVVTVFGADATEADAWAKMMLYIHEFKRTP